MLTKTGQLIVHIIIIVSRYLLGRSGRRGSVVNADPSVVEPVTRL